MTNRHALILADGKFQEMASSDTLLGKVKGRGLQWVVLDNSITSQEIAPNTGYVAGSTSQVEFTVPSSPQAGDAFAVTSQNSGGWRIYSPTSGAIIIGNQVAYSTGKYVESTHYADSISCVCVYADESTSIWYTDGAPQGILNIDGNSGLTTINAVNNSLSGQSGTGNFVGSILPIIDSLKITGDTYGSATLVAGTITVTTAAVNTGDSVFLSCTAQSGTPGLGLPVITIVDATSFTLTSQNVLDESTFDWWIVKH